ncbi:MAG: biotin transporter BioY [Dethiobacter sp.]|jgi:biotin transport system substrate-specific component|nr:MAG: biotin transporter BioY [Dethiobacter sp.]
MLKTKYLILSGLFATITALLAQISIPLPFSPVPITGQIFGVFLIGTILGGRWGAISMLTYVFLGAIGLPVFHNAQGGLHIVLGPTGGYLWGFVLGSYLLGKTVEKRNSYLSIILGMFLCLAATYSLGVLQLSFIAGLNLRQGLLLGAAPFLPLDIVKLFAASGLSLSVRQRLLKAVY